MFELGLYKFFFFHRDFVFAFNVALYLRYTRVDTEFWCRVYHAFVWSITLFFLCVAVPADYAPKYSGVTYSCSLTTAALAAGDSVFGTASDICSVVVFGTPGICLVKMITQFKYSSPP